MGWKPAAMVEGEESSIDTLMYRPNNNSSNAERVLVPVALEEQPIRSIYTQSEPDSSHFIPEKDTDHFMPDLDHSWPEDVDHVQTTASNHA